MTAYLVPFGSRFYDESRDDDYCVLEECTESMRLHSVPITSSWTCKNILAVLLSAEDLKLMSSETRAQLEGWGVSKPDLWFIDETKDHPMRLLVLACLIKDWPEFKDFFETEFGERINIEGKDEKLILSMEKNIERWESEIPHKNNLLKRLFAKRQLEEYLKGRFLDTKSGIFPELDLDLIDSKYGYEGEGPDDKSCLKDFLEQKLGIKATPVFVYAEGSRGCIPELGNADYFAVKKYGKDEVVIISEEVSTYHTDFREISLPLDLWEEAMKIGAVILL